MKKIDSNSKIKFSCDLSELAKIRDFILGKAKNFGFSDIESNKIALAVDEACTNLIRHTFKCDCSKDFFIQLEFELNQFIVNILDSGKPFNPLDIDEPDMNDYIEKHKRGGLGIHIMRSVMDEISYTPFNEQSPNNILRLKKQRQTSDTQSN